MKESLAGSRELEYLLILLISLSPAAGEPRGSPRNYQALPTVVGR